MNRYQIYLDPKSVNTLNELAKLVDISRSKIIRDIINRMARQYDKILRQHQKRSLKNNPLLKMAGFAKGGDPGLSKRVDEIYLKD